jgi:hypothetical protein
VKVEHAAVNRAGELKELEEIVWEVLFSSKDKLFSYVIWGFFVQDHKKDKHVLVSALGDNL